LYFLPKRKNNLDIRIGFGRQNQKKIIKRKKMKKVIIFILAVTFTACSSRKAEENCCIYSTQKDSTIVVPIDSIKVDTTKVVDSLVSNKFKK